MLGSANALISFVRLEHGDIHLINVARIVKSTSNASDQFSIGHSSFQRRRRKPSLASKE